MNRLLRTEGGTPKEKDLYLRQLYQRCSWTSRVSGSSLPRTFRARSWRFITGKPGPLTLDTVSSSASVHPSAATVYTDVLLESKADHLGKLCQNLTSTEKKAQSPETRLSRLSNPHHQKTLSLTAHEAPPAPKNLCFHTHALGHRKTCREAAIVP